MNTSLGSRETGPYRGGWAHSGRKWICQPPAASAKAPSKKVIRVRHALFDADQERPSVRRYASKKRSERPMPRVYTFSRHSKSKNQPVVVSQEVWIPPLGLAGTLNRPDGGRALVIFAHGSGSSRFSSRNIRVAEALNRRGIATRSEEHTSE